ncbi:hypothetical protein KQX54_020770 [Cotesia glomerata]|uniref:Uncharacterized protein n=1 Tax=Cotesia glomerata TaxID=32391 RepID=A0AAV7I1F8_COTGL|nr:hypothetical protein KQX54_020770 [Cotesia glomerata]
MTPELIAAVLTGAEHVNRIIVFAVNIVLENGKNMDMCMHGDLDSKSAFECTPEVKATILWKKDTPGSIFDRSEVFKSFPQIGILKRACLLGSLSTLELSR